jgi:two-component system cell cycle sensor histidine kinase/response regulator CckA
VGLGAGRAVPAPTGSGRMLEGFISDITERKLLESQVLQNQRLESIGTLAGGIAHDLNNVFAPIMMAGDLLEDKVTDKDSAQLLDVVAASAKRGAELVRQILLFARGMEGPRVAVNPSALFAEIGTFLESTFPKSIRVDFESPRADAISGTPPSSTSSCSTSASTRGMPCPAGARSPSHASPASVSPSSPRPHPDAVPGDFVRIDVADTGPASPTSSRARYSTRSSPRRASAAAAASASRPRARS